MDIELFRYQINEFHISKLLDYKFRTGDFLDIVKLYLDYKMSSEDVNSFKNFFQTTNTNDIKEQYILSSSDAYNATEADYGQVFRNQKTFPNAFIVAKAGAYATMENYTCLNLLDYLFELLVQRENELILKNIFKASIKCTSVSDVKRTMKENKLKNIKHIILDSHNSHWNIDEMSKYIKMFYSKSNIIYKENLYPNNIYFLGDPKNIGKILIQDYDLDYIQVNPLEEDLSKLYISFCVSMKLNYYISVNENYNNKNILTI